MLSFGKWKMTLVVLVSLAGFFFTAPNAFRDGQIPPWMTSWWKPITLGLDLQGGSYLLLQVEYEALIAEHLDAMIDTARRDLRGEKVAYTGLRREGLSLVVTITNEADWQKAIRLLRLMEPGLDVDADEGTVRIRFSEATVDEKRKMAVDQSIEIVRKRVDETGTREPVIQRQGQNRIIVELPGVGDPQHVKALIGQTAKLTFHLVDANATPEDYAQKRAPAGSVILPEKPSAQDLLLPQELRSEPRRYIIKKRPEVTGDHLIDAKPVLQDGAPVVSFKFDTTGGRRFGQVTTENVNGFLAIVLDGEIISAPRINGPITGGSGVITGNFTMQSAGDLALLLRAGALPAPLTTIEERTVGPGLGQDSIDAGTFAAVLGGVAVFIFMVVCYGLFGFFASLALLVNIGLLLGLLGLLGATLTLPGIAGIALTIGMAVDANVLIFERIREEIRAGRTPLNAVDAGFSNAFSAIFDANITTLFAAVLLYAFGSGPVRGFAVTLSIGVLTSMFTAILVTRAIITVWLRMARPKTIRI